MVAGWFLCSAVNTAGVKAGLTLLKPRSCGFSLTAMQFTAAALFQAALAAATGRLRPLPAGSLVEVSRIACAYTLGFLTLNLAMGLLAASFAETVRGLEPLFSFGLVRLCGGRGGALSLAAGGALATLLVGAALACGAQPNFSRAGLALGMLSNFCFACRSLLTTRMQARCAAQFHAILRCAILRRAIRRRCAAAALCAQDARRASPDADEIDGHTLFLHQHLLGLALVLPAALAVEGPGCALHAWHAHGRAAPPLVLSALGFYGCVRTIAATHRRRRRRSVREARVPPPRRRYNLLSLLCLLQMNAVAHSVANSCRRALTIGSAAIYFGTPMGPASVAGVVLVVGGAAWYAVAKNAAAAAARAAAPTAADDGEFAKLKAVSESVSEDDDGP